jgi:16S rRNA (guanine527-N7)-methyltransferase
MNDLAADDAEALSGIAEVSRETRQRLERFIALLRKWGAAQSLVAPSTLPQIWRRHVADSAQLLAVAPEALRWLDLGTGAGFPGLVIAILLAERVGSPVHLVESNQRKCAFLRRAIAETGAPASVHEGRIEAVLADWSEPVEIITARALAPLPRLFDLVAPLLPGTARLLFPKGRDFAGEVAEASKSWHFDLVNHRSRINGGGVILDITGLAPRPAEAKVSRDAAP